MPRTSKASGRGCSVARGVNHSEIKLEIMCERVRTSLDAEGKPFLFFQRHTLDF